MAKRYIDASVVTTRDGMTDTDGTSLTLTNAVRILYDNTTVKSDLITLIDRVRDKIIETMP